MSKKKITKAIVSETCPACKYTYKREEYYKNDETLKTFVLEGDEAFDRMRVRATNGDAFSFFICPKCGIVVLKKRCRSFNADDISEDDIP